MNYFGFIQILSCIFFVVAANALHRIPVVRNPKFKPFGLQTYVHTMHKYNIRPSMPGPYHRQFQGGPLMMRLSDGSNGAVPAEDQGNDLYYTCPVEIGTPPQVVKLNFDTGSSDLWVKSTELRADVLSHEYVPVFDPSKSTTFQKVDGASWRIQYADDSTASGNVGVDTVRIGQISIEGQVVECATQISYQFSGDQSSGLLGLAWGNINTVQPTSAKTPVENMIAQQDIPKDKELFTVFLSSVRDLTDPDGGKSFYTFGAIDDDLVQRSGQQLSWAPIDNSKGYWMYDSPSMTVNGEIFETPGNRAVMDTGTSLSLVDDDVLAHIYGQIPGAYYNDGHQGWLLPTGNVKARSNITFAIGDRQFTIEKEHLALYRTNRTMSYGSIQSRGDLPYDIMGVPMLVGIYCVFDVGNQRIGVIQRPDPTPAGK